MNGNMLYLQYMKPGSEYFSKMKVIERDTEYELKGVPDTYTIISEEDSVWKHYQVKGLILPEQGWKIHVTATLEESQSLLERVAHICIEQKVTFKHLKDRDSFLRMNAKDANRASSGKFITIYPINNKHFVELLDIISDATKDFKKGPYILNDKRWKDSNVFYRYGGFGAILNENGEHCIRDLEGNLIKDQRTPFYHVPDFVKDFDDYLNSINKYVEKEKIQEGNLEKYDIENAINYSNAGGVYLATRKKDKMKVIIKEARPKAGLDGAAQDAIARQKIEYEALIKLKDIPGVVDLIDYFQEWEHCFLVEEYIEGQDLRQWTAQNFPFIGTRNNIKIYTEKVKDILLQLFTLIDNIHKNGVAMNDLQPANVIVTDDLTVRLIDFETAKPVYSEDRTGMATIGFVSRDIKVSGARDWFGLKRLIKYLALPVTSSEDLDGYLQNNHFNWMRENYEESFFNFIVKLQKKCDMRIKSYQEYTPREINLNNHSSNYNISFIIDKLLRGIKKNLTNDERFINGDIRQFEMSGGKFNFLTGGSGAAFTLIKKQICSKEVDNWINNYLLDNLDKIEDNGLLTGKTGILALLYESGYIDVVNNELMNIKESINEKNISLRSGIAGIGLFMISLYLETKDKKYLDISENLDRLIDLNRMNGEPLKTNDWMAVDIGVIDGLAGVSLFYSALYSATNNEKYLEKAESFLKKDLERTQKDDTSGVLQTLDNNNRLLPYLSGGSIGIAISIWFLNHVSGKDLYREEMDAILKLYKTRCTISGSLFDGAGSFLLIPSMIESGKSREEILSSVLSLLNIFLIEKDDYYVFPGQFSYRLADDVYTGSSGIILALMAIVKENPLYWLPLINVDKFLERTKAKQLLEQ
jgi:serine/threonine protein kinase